MSEVGHLTAFLSHLTQHCHLIAMSCVPVDYLQAMLATNTCTFHLVIAFSTCSNHPTTLPIMLANSKYDMPLTTS